MKKIKNDNLDNLYNFIIDTHTQIKDNYKEVVEIRALRSDKKDKRAYRSYAILNDSISQKESFFKWINKLDSENIPYCLFYSVFSFSQNDKSQKKINSDNSSMTSILVADFDNINKNDFDKEIQRFKNVDCMPSYVIFSGHGYQCVWLLDEPTKEKHILEKWTRLLNIKGFKNDIKITDSARVMRLPYTYNTKDNIKDELKDNDNIIQIETRLVEVNNKSYSLNRLFIGINSLDDIKPLETQNIEELEHIIKDVDEINEKNYQYYNVNRIYDNFKGILTKRFIEELPGQQKAILYHGLIDDYANAIITQMTLFFRDYKGLTLDKIKSINVRLSTVNKEYHGSYDMNKIINTTERYFNSQYKFNSKELSLFGKFGSYTINDVMIDNSLFNENISNIAFYIYVRLSIQVRQEMKAHAYKNTFTMNDIVNIIGKSRQKLKPKLDELINNKLIYKTVRKNRKEKGSNDTYHLNPYIKQHGFTTFNQSDISNFINALNNKVINETSLRILLFIKYQINKQESQGEKEILISQENIGKHCNCKQDTISKAFKKIDDLNHTTDILGNEYIYLTRNLVYLGNNKACYEYIISY